jgi:hypothetical protein
LRRDPQTWDALLDRPSCTPPPFPPSLPSVRSPTVLPILTPILTLPPLSPSPPHPTPSHRPRSPPPPPPPSPCTTPARGAGVKPAQDSQARSGPDRSPGRAVALDHRSRAVPPWPESTGLPAPADRPVHPPLERAHPGELVHMDTEQPGWLRGVGGYGGRRVLGRDSDQHRRRGRERGLETTMSMTPSMIPTGRSVPRCLQRAR